MSKKANPMRRARRAAQREAAKRGAPPPLSPAEQAELRARQATALSGYVEGYKGGFGEGYIRALEDLRAPNVVAHVARDMHAVHHDPREQAKYVLSRFQQAMEPKDTEAFLRGVDRALTEHLRSRELLPAWQELQGDEEEGPRLPEDAPEPVGGVVLPTVDEVRSLGATAN